MGTVLPGVLSGHWRHAHINGVRGDGVNPGLLRMDGTVSEDAVRPAMYRIPETTGLDGCDREFMSYPAAKGNTGVPPVLASGHPDRCKSLVGRSAPLDQGLRMKCGNKHEKYGLLFNFNTQVVCDPMCPRLQPGINSQFPVELLLNFDA